MSERRKPIRERDLQGLKYLDLLLAILGRLHDVGCQRDKAGKPTLRTCEMVCYYLMGWADLDEFTAHLEKLQPTR